MPTDPLRSRWSAALYWAAPSLLCLLVYWRGLQCWFLQDDFVWLGLRAGVHDWHSLLTAIFVPTGHGTFRPLSERAYFLVFHSLFGLNALPFRIWAYLTFFADLVLLCSVVRRMSGSRVAGFGAAVFWAVHPAMMTAMTWNSAYMQILCGFFLLLAFHFLLRHIETGRWRYYLAQLAVFVAGFGVMETNVVYPVLAAGYTFLCARKYFRRVLPLFGISIAFLVLDMALAPKAGAGVYAVHFDASVWSTFKQYWRWALLPMDVPKSWSFPGWALPAGRAALTAAFAAVLVWHGWRKHWLPVLLLGWFVVLLAPVLPLRDLRQYYYLTLPLLGLSAFAGYAFSRGFENRTRWKAAAVTLAALYLALSMPVSIRTTKGRLQLTRRVRQMVERVADLARSESSRVILLSGVDNELFWQAIYDRPFEVAGARNVYLVPGTETRIQARDGVSIDDYVAPALPDQDELKRRAAVILAVDHDMKDVTAEWVPRAPKEREPPQRIEVGKARFEPWLGEGWLPADGGMRWMGKRARVRIAAPREPPGVIQLTAYCVPQQVAQGPLTLVVTVNGIALPATEIRHCGERFHRILPLPPQQAGNRLLDVVMEVDRTFRPSSDSEDLGLVFGTVQTK